MYVQMYAHTDTDTHRHRHTHTQIGSLYLDTSCLMPSPPLPRAPPPNSRPPLSKCRPYVKCLCLLQKKKGGDAASVSVPIQGHMRHMRFKRQ